MCETARQIRCSGGVYLGSETTTRAMESENEGLWLPNVYLCVPICLSGDFRAISASYYFSHFSHFRFGFFFLFFFSSNFGLQSLFGLTRGFYQMTNLGISSCFPLLFLSFFRSRFLPKYPAFWVSFESLLSPLKAPNGPKNSPHGCTERHVTLTERRKLRRALFLQATLLWYDWRTQIGFDEGLKRV